MMDQEHGEVALNQKNTRDPLPSPPQEETSKCIGGGKNDPMMYTGKKKKVFTYRGGLRLRKTLEIII